jgi:hypothetical protein
MARRRLALVALNPGKTRKIRLGKRRGGLFVVEIDKATKRVLQAAAGGAPIPKHWIGVEWKRVKPLERALLGAARNLRGCIKQTTCYEPKRDRRGRRRRCRRSFGRVDEFVRAFNDASDNQIENYLEILDPGDPQLGDLAQYADRRGGKRGRKKKFPSWKAAVRWVAPRSRRWLDTDERRIKELAEKMREALQGPSGATSALEYSGHAWQGLVAPHEVQRLHQEEHDHRSCRDLFDQEAADLVDAFRRELEDLIPF